MKPEIQLVSYKICPYVQRVRFALEEVRMPYSIRFINPYEPKPEWFLELSESGKVPMLLVNNRVIVNSADILDFINDYSGNVLLPEKPDSLKNTRLIISKIEHYHACLRLVYSVNVIEEYTVAINSFKQEMISLERQLNDPYLDLNEINMLSFYYAPLLKLSDIVGELVDEDFIEHSGKLALWKDRIISADSYVKAMEDDYLSELMVFFKAKQSVLSALYLS